MQILGASALPLELPIAETVGVVGESMQERSILYWNWYNKMELNNAHLEGFVVAVVLKPFHELRDVRKPFRTAAILKKEDSMTIFDDRTARTVLVRRWS